jgi:hypothetical protein
MTHRLVSLRDRGSEERASGEQEPLQVAHLELSGIETSGRGKRRRGARGLSHCHAGAGDLRARERAAFGRDAATGREQPDRLIQPQSI